MLYGSVCSGIETAALAFPRHWKAAWFAEVDPFCCALLEQRHQGAPNVGDIIQTEVFPPVELVIGGTPCQSFSIQGKRGGLDDPRGNLTLRFAQIVRICKPRWFIWENVPNVLRIERGRALGALVRQMGEFGYSVAWRVLDVQYFGLPQRRERVVLVGHRGADWRPAAFALFDGPQSGADATSTAEVLVSRQSTVGVSRPLLGWTGDETPKFGIEITPTLRASQGGEGVGIVTADGVARRLTLTEWERLQGLPDEYTKIDGWSDRSRKRAIGNAFGVNLFRWIADRIDTIDSVSC